MIITLFILLLAFSLVLIISGRYIDAPALQLAGYCFMFLLGVVVLFGAVEYASGETTTQTYGCGCCNNYTFVLNYTTTGSCEGTPPTCDTYDLNQINCEAHNCTYNTTTDLCSGTPYACDYYSTAELCNREQLCEWTGSSSSSCENGTTLVKTGENKTITYSAFTSEIYAGVNINHIVGLFMAIISGLGFAIVLMNLDKFKINERGI